MHIEVSDDHRYFVDGKHFPSVTQILEAEGLANYRFHKSEARQRGTLVHQIADLLDDGWEACHRTASTADDIIAASRWNPSTTTEALVPYGYAYCHFLLSYKPQWIRREFAVASTTYCFAGRLDRYGVLDGKRTLVDIKSGEPTDAASVQEALYALALEETTGDKTEAMLSLWLRPTGRPHCIPASGEGLRIGLCAVQLYHWRKDRKLFT